MSVNDPISSLIPFDNLCFYWHLLSLFCWHTTCADLTMNNMMRKLPNVRGSDKGSRVDPRREIIEYQQRLVIKEGQ